MKPPDYLLNNKSQLSKLVPADQAIRYDGQRWGKYFSQDPDFASISARHQLEISRQDLFHMKSTMGGHPSDTDLRRFFIAVMIWGFGTTGYGPYRTHRMVQDGAFAKSVRESYNHVQQGDIVKAYNSMNVDMCGSAFFTKYMYFCGHNGPSAATKPLILDAVVARSLEDKCGCQISRYARASRFSSNLNAKTYRSAKAGRISALGRDPHAYMNYINDLDTWANSLGVTADQIELFLFS